MQCLEQRRVELQHWLAAGDNHQAMVPPLAPQLLDHRRQSVRTAELAAILAIGADKIRVAKSALGRRPILFPARPQITPGKAQEHCPAPRLNPFALKREEGFLDRVAHRRAA